MFDNKFLKHDPLVEAVKQAQQDGAVRRLAEAMTNELFEVYSRQAVVREHLADYDFALEEAYKCMKEAEKKDEKKEDKPKSDYSKMREKMVGKGKDLETTRKIVGEAEKMADKDYDGDGKVETSKKEVWGSRLRAAKASGKYKGPVDEAGPVDAGSMEGSKSVTKSAPKEDPSTPKVPYSQLPKTGNRAGAVIDSAKGALKEYHLEEERKRTASVADAFMSGKKANQRTLKTDGQSVTYHGNTIAKHAGDEVHVTTAGHALSPSTRGHVNGILSRLGSPKLSVKKGQLHHGDTPVDHDSWIKVKKPEKATFNESAYSAKSSRAGKDIGKPGKMFAKIAAKAGERYGSAERGKSVAGAILKKIRAKHMKEENLEELSQFGSAFAAARKGGQSTFNFGGKSYSTAMKGGPSVSSKSSGPQNNPGLGGAVRSGQFATRDTTPIATRSPEQKQAKVDASAVRANKSAMPNPTIGTPNLGRSGSTQSAVGPKGEVTPGSSADYAQKNGMTSTPSSKTSIGVGSGTQAIKDINKSPSAVASVNAANKAPSSTMDTVKSGLASAGAAIDKATGGMAGAAYDKARSAVGLKEEVQVGENKYRIF